MSIFTSRESKKPQIVAKPRQCRECFRLQHRCSECSMRLLLKKHLTGRTNQREFNEFLVRCFSETSSDHRRIFSNALEQVGRELNLTDGARHGEVKPGGSVTEQLAILNRNRTLVGGMRRQTPGIANRAGRIIKKKASTENLGKGSLNVDTQTDGRGKKVQDGAKKNEKEIFVIDKNDPTLKKISRADMLNENAATECKTPVRKVKIGGKPAITLSQVNLEAEFLKTCHSARNLTVHSFIVDVINEQETLEQIKAVKNSNEDEVSLDKQEERFLCTFSPEENRSKGTNKLLDTQNEGIERFDKVEKAFSDLDNMLKEINQDLEDDESVPLKGKKSKTDVRCVII